MKGAGKPQCIVIQLEWSTGDRSKVNILIMDVSIDHELTDQVQLDRIFPDKLVKTKGSH